MARTALVVAVLAASHSLGCTSSGSMGRMSALEEQQRQREHEMQLLDARIAAARREAARQECLATAAEIRAAVTVDRATCLEQRSKFAECESKNSEQTSSGGFLGCLLGLGVAVATGGAAAPMTLLGCGGGAALGSAAGSECGPNPVCTPDTAVLTREALQRRPTADLTACPEADPRIVVFAGDWKSTTKLLSTQYEVSLRVESSGAFAATYRDTTTKGKTGEQPISGQLQMNGAEVTIAFPQASKPTPACRLVSQSDVAFRVVCPPDPRFPGVESLFPSPFTRQARTGRAN